MKFNKYTLIAATLSFAGRGLSAEPVPVPIRLHVYVEISPAALKLAKETASSAMAQAGVRLSWAECSTKEDVPSKDAVCDQPITPLDLQIRIVDKAMAKRAGKRSNCLGYAIVAGEFSSIAAAYFHRALELEGGNLADRGPILGAIIAHEIGHLLGVAQHSETGLMRARWDDQDLKSLAKGRLLFTGDQAIRLRTAVDRRAVEATRVSLQSRPPEIRASALSPNPRTNPAPPQARR